MKNKDFFKNVSFDWKENNTLVSSLKLTMKKSDTITSILQT